MRPVRLLTFDFHPSGRILRGEVWFDMLVLLVRRSLDLDLFLSRSLDLDLFLSRSLDLDLFLSRSLDLDLFLSRSRE